MRAAPLYDEKTLLKQVSEGSETAFSQLFHSFHHQLGDYIFYLTKSLPLAEEIVQDVFMKIWEKREQLETVNNFGAYLFTISKNQAFNVLRQQAREAVKLQKLASHVTSEQEVLEPDMEKYFILIDTAVSQLPAQQQKVWLLSRQEGLKHEEIATRLSLSRETVKRHISLALTSIRRYVKLHVYMLLLVWFSNS